MALEDAINNLATAINRYVDLQAGAKPIERTAEVKETKKLKDSTTSVSTKSEPSQSTLDTSDATNSSTAETSTASESTATSSDEQPVDYKALQAKFQELVTKDVELAKSVLTQLGFPKLALVPANLHANAYALTEKALNNG